MYYYYLTESVAEKRLPFRKIKFDFYQNMVENYIRSGVLPRKTIPIACAFSLGNDIVAQVVPLSAAKPESSDCAGDIARSPEEKKKTKIFNCIFVIVKIGNRMKIEHKLPHRHTDTFVFYLSSFHVEHQICTRNLMLCD